MSRGRELAKRKCRLTFQVPSRGDSHFCAPEFGPSPPECRISLSRRHLLHANEAFAQSAQKVSQ